MMGGEVAQASALLEAAARARGVEVRRLDGEVVLCRDGEHEGLFHGFTGTAGRVAHALCGNDAWLRAHLARHGVPVVESRLVGPDDARFAQRTAEELGYPVRMRLAGQPARTGQPAYTGQPGAHTVADAASFGRAWQAVVGQVPDRHCRLILEHRPAGEAVEVAVIGDQTITSLSGTVNELSHTASELGLRVLATLPGVSCASVRIVSDSARAVVDRVDLAFLSWIKGATATAVAKAILSYALPASANENG